MILLTTPPNDALVLLLWLVGSSALCIVSWCVAEIVWRIGRKT